MKRLLISLAALLTIGITAPVAIAGVGYADALTDGVKATCSGSDCEEKKDADGNVITAADKADTLVKTIVDIFSWVVGVLSVIFVIVGGFKYVTSGGDAGKVTSAKNTILYALVGLVIVALAQTIVFFVLELAT